MNKNEKKQKKDITTLVSENSIVEWKQRFKLITDASELVVYEYCLRDGSIEWSGSVEKILGYKLSEINGGIKQWEKLIHKEDREKVIQELKTAEKNLSPYNIEYRFKNKNGHYINLHDRGFFVSIPEKKCIRMVGMIQDITSQKRSDQLIKALNSAVIEMQKVVSREEVFKVVAEELKKLNIESIMLIADENKENLIFKYFSYDSKLIKIAEKVAGIKADTLKIKIKNIKEYNEVLYNKKTILVIENYDFVRRILPGKLKFMSEQITKTFKISRFILAPLIIDDKVIGAFSVQAEDLNESDIPAVTIFAHQMAGAWNKSELIEKIQKDIIIQKQTEKSLQESEELFRKIFEESPLGMVMSNLDFQFTKVNQSFCNMIGYTEFELIAKKFTNITHPDYPDLEKELEIIKNIKNGELSHYKAEKPYLTKNKKKVWGSLTVSSIRDNNGKFQYFLAMVEDITERKLAEQKLEESSRKINTLINNLPGVVYRCKNDEDWTMEYISNGILLLSGYPPEDFINNNIRTFNSIIKPDEREIIRKKVQKALKDKKQFMIEYKIITATGNIKWVRERGMGIVEKNKIVALEGYIMDVTDAKEAEKKLKEANIKLNRAQKVAKIGSWEILLSTNERKWSNNMYEIMGFPKGITVNMEELEKRVPSGELSRFKTAINEAINTGKPYSMDYKIIMQNGKEKYIHDEGEVVKDNSGKVIAMFGTTQDITENKLAEIALKESEERYRSIFDNAPIGMFHSTVEGKIINVNSGFVKMMGYDSIEEIKEKVNKSNVSEVLYVEGENRNKFIHEVIEKGNWKTFENQYRRKDGIIMTGVVTFRSFTNVINNTVELEGFVTDISKRKIAEENLQKSEERFKQVAESADEWIWEVDKEGLYTYASPIVEKILGYKPEELINKVHFYELFIFEDRETLKKTAFKVNEKKQSIKGMINKNLHKNGNIVVLETNGSPILDENNNFIGYRGVDKDITERMRAEENLRRSEERFRAITEQTTDVVFVTDSRGFITYLSPAAEKIFGLPIPELIGKHITSMLPEEEIGRAMEAFQYTVANSVPVRNFEMKMIGKDGMIIYGELNGNYFSVGDFVGTAGTLRDITERKRAQEELIKAKEKAEEMNRIKSSFLANMSHEVRTPLVAILGFSEILSELIKEEDLKNYVEMIHKGGERLLDTLNLILDLSVIESQKMKIELTPLNVVEEVLSVVSLFERAAKRKNLIIESLCEEKSLIINLDVKIFRQIMNNLINNAIKYTNTGRVSVKIKKENRNGKNYLAIRVEDTGIGIPDSKKLLIWEEFRQVSEGLNRSFEGTGLGLSITKKFVEKLGGEISLEKSEVEIGSTFLVLFPMGEIQREKNLSETKSISKEKKEIVYSNENLPVILYIEDDPTAIDIVKAFSSGICNVDWASTGLDGLEKIKNNKYDAVLVDINLGMGINGLEVTKKIREIHEYKDIPIVAATAFAMIGDKEEFFENGCTHYISKPFSKIEFIQLISDVLNKSK